MAMCTKSFDEENLSEMEKRNSNKACTTLAMFDHQINSNQKLHKNSSLAYNKKRFLAEPSRIILHRVMTFST